MTESFANNVRVGWQDTDANGHMRNSAYLDAASNTRLLYFATHGFPMSEFDRLRIGPVILKDVLEYRHEFLLMDGIKVTFETVGQTEDGSRFRVRNTFYRADGEVGAILTSDGGWLELERRRLVPPPEALFAAMMALRTADYELLPRSQGAT